MCAYGDSTNRPVKETVEAVEGVAVEFVRGVITRALEHVSSALEHIFCARRCTVIMRVRRGKGCARNGMLGGNGVHHQV